MEAKKNPKYRVHAKVHDTWNSSELRYVIQQKVLLIWWTISEELETEKYAQEMCDKLNGYNSE
jgi:hypothetical protein